MMTSSDGNTGTIVGGGLMLLCHYDPSMSSSLLGLQDLGGGGGDDVVAVLLAAGVATVSITWYKVDVHHNDLLCSRDCVEAF
jgi:hypothetical protein